MSAWQNFVKKNMGPGETLKSLADQYHAQRGGQGPDDDDLKLNFITTCEGDCSKHVDQLNVYIKYLYREWADEVIGYDTISDSQQIVLYSNLFLVNLATYLTEHYGSPIYFTDSKIGKAVVEGNNMADKALLFRTNFFKWMGSQEFADLFNDISIGCAANTRKTMKNNYIIKVSCIAYGLQLLFEDSDLQELIGYLDGSWFPTFLRNLSRQILSVTTECSSKVSVVRKGLRVLGKAVKTLGKVTGKVAWYAGVATWYTSKHAVTLVGKIPGVKTSADIFMLLTAFLIDFADDSYFFRANVFDAYLKFRESDLLNGPPRVEHVKQQQQQQQRQQRQQRPPRVKKHVKQQQQQQQRPPRVKKHVKQQQQQQQFFDAVQ
jgi:hypothetical protein